MLLVSSKETMHGAGGQHMARHRSVLEGTIQSDSKAARTMISGASGGVNKRGLQLVVVGHPELCPGIPKCHILHPYATGLHLFS